MRKAKAERRGLGLLPMVLGLGAVVAVVLLTQRALAEQLGGWIAGVWVSTMSAVMSILGVFLGG